MALLAPCSLFPPSKLLGTPFRFLNVVFPSYRILSHIPPFFLTRSRFLLSPFLTDCTLWRPGSPREELVFFSSEFSRELEGSTAFWVCRFRFFILRVGCSIFSPPTAHPFSPPSPVHEIIYELFNSLGDNCPILSSPIPGLYLPAFRAFCGTSCYPGLLV